MTRSPEWRRTRRAGSNHDVERHNSRWGKGLGADFAKMTLALLFSMRGSVCLYQGDELGLPQADVDFEDIQDPYGLPFWPKYKGRDGCRTPMPWDDSSGAGFSDVKPWLPISAEHRALSVATQTQDQQSVLVFSRRFIKWRKAQQALVYGDIKLVEGTPSVLCWIRESADQRLFVAINTTGEMQKAALPFLDGQSLTECGFKSTAEGDFVVLPPFQVAYIEQVK